jgi:hemoglobin/transferrin/lactoferrin receptor protein
VGSLRTLIPLTTGGGVVLYAGASQGFRAPNLSDLTRLDTARSSEIETPVSDLDPEKFISYEVGLKSRAGRLTSQLACYYTDIDGMIVRAPTGRTIDGLAEVTKKNAGAGYVRGVEFSGTYAISASWSAWAALGVMDGKVDGYPTSDTETSREYISRLMPPTLEAGFRWKSKNGKYWSEVACNAAEKADRLSADDVRDTQRIPPGGTPGYAVVAVRAGTKLYDNMDLSIAVENVGDMDYRIHGSGVNEPGRNAILTVACVF